MKDKSQQVETEQIPHEITTVVRDPDNQSSVKPPTAPVDQVEVEAPAPPPKQK